MPVSCYYVALAQVRGNSGRTPLRPNVATALWAVSRRIMQAQNVRRLTEPWLQLRKSTHSKLSGHDKNLVGPRILYLGPRRVTAHIHIPSTGIKRTEHVPGLVRHRFRRWKFRLRI